MHIRLRMFLAVLLLAVVNLPAPGREVRAVGAQRFVVPSSGAASGACPQSAACTLAYALSTSVAGDELILAWGGYSGSGTEVLYIDKSLTIRGGWDGASSGPVVIDTSIYSTQLYGANTRRVIRADLESETLTLQDLTITGGSLVGSSGGGLYIVSPDGFPGTVNLNRVRVTGNGSASNPQYGGGMSAAGVSLYITDSYFGFNQIQHGGGAIKLYDADAIISETRFEQNVSNYGSALEVEDASTVEFERCVFVRNQASSVLLISGAGPALTVTNSYLIHNSGLLVEAMGGDLNLYHNTLVGPESGVGLSLWDSVTGEMYNNILSSFATSISLGAGNTGFSISHTLFHNNTNNPAMGTNAVVGDPCFIDPPMDEPGYHITQCSEAIDAGTPAGVTVDYDMDLRPLLGGYDIGADEFGWVLSLPLILR